MKKEEIFIMRQGYDISIGKFFVQFSFSSANSTGKVSRDCETEVEKFDTFSELYAFTGGDIYSNACFFPYKFTSQDISTYCLDTERLNADPFVSKHIEDFTSIMPAEELQQYRSLEKGKATICKWQEKIDLCNTGAEVLQVYTKFKKSKFYSSKMFTLMVLRSVQHTPDQKYSLLMELINHGVWGIFDRQECHCFLCAACELYGSDLLRRSYVCEETFASTSTRNERKKSVADLCDLWDRSHGNSNDFRRSTAYVFDVDTHMYVEKELVIAAALNAEGYRESYTIVRDYHDSFEALVSHLNGDLSACHLNDAYLPQYNFSASNCPLSSWPTHAMNGLTMHIEKSFADHGRVTIYWENKSNFCVKKRHWKFRYFQDFCAFLNNDLSNSDLLFCEGLDSADLNLSQVNFTGTKVRSSVANTLRLDIPKDQLISCDIGNIQSFPATISNEDQTTEVALRDDPDVDRNQQEEPIAYISDLHLLHRITREKCVTGNDIEYSLTKAVDALSDSISFYCKNILIAGDTASNSFLFSRFVKVLSKKLPRKNIIFTLGNHDLWDHGSKPLSFWKIAAQYRQFLNRHGMFLLEHNLLYMTDDGPGELTAADLREKSKEELHCILKKARSIYFGGMGFATYQKDFNANNGIYLDVITRDEEIALGKEFEALYHTVCEKLGDKRIVILTHFPPADWVKEFKPHENFIYVSGHTHRNAFYDDGVYRIYADNQMGYSRAAYSMKSFLLSNQYDTFEDYPDGIYHISKEEYANFYKGKRMDMRCSWANNGIYMLKKSSVYMFIYRNKTGSLSILNGGARGGSLQFSDIQYYYDNMDAVVEKIEEPLGKYRAAQEQLASIVKRIGGTGYIHGCIIDITFFEHIYLNPFDGTATGYSALNIKDKNAYRSIPALLEAACPALYTNYRKLLSSSAESIPAIWRKQSLSTLPIKYTSTTMYAASRQIKKMQRLTDHILSVWVDDVGKPPTLTSSGLCPRKKQTEF